MRPRINRVSSVAGVLALTVVATMCALIIGTGPAAASDSSDLFANTNASRAQYGLGPLSYDSAASSIAQSWSSQLASAGALSHNPNLASQISAQVTNDWTRIGENVGYAGDANALENAFMGSQAHMDNILGDYNRVGVGTTRGGDGRLWAAVVFVKGPELASAAPSSNPFGSIDGFVVGPGYVSIQGWAADPGTASGIEVDALVDSRFAGYQTALGNRPDVGAALPAFGPNHGFRFDAVMDGGFHTLCVYAINVGPGVNTLLGCQGFDVPASPLGQLDALVPVNGQVRAQGWAIDPQTSGYDEINVLVDGGLTGWGAAYTSRPDVGRVYPLFGDRHGFDMVAPMGAGTHTVCVYAINVGAGVNTLLGCRSITR